MPWSISAGFHRFQERFIWPEIYRSEYRKMQLTLFARKNCPEASLAKLQRSDFTYMIMYDASLRY